MSWWTRWRSRSDSERPPFAELAEAAFIFLEERGFRLARRSEWLLRYERADRDVFADVYREFDGELGFQVGRLSHPKEVFPSHVVMLTFAPLQARSISWFPRTPERLAERIPVLARIVEDRYGDLLDGSEEAFAVLRSRADEMSRLETLQGRFGAKMMEADRAWRAKDFVRAQALYTEAEEALDDRRKARLAELRSGVHRG